MEGIQRLADQIAEREDQLDILVNNAGAAWGQPFAEFSEAGWDRTMDLNVKTPFFLTQKLHGLLKAAASAERPAKVHQYLQHRRAADQPVANLSLPGVKGGGDPPDTAAGGRAGA